MLKKTSQMIVALATAALAIVPVAAQANTRAGDSGAVYSAPVSQPGTARANDGETFAGGASVFALVLVALWLSGIVLIAVDEDDEDRQSPGT